MKHTRSTSPTALAFSPEPDAFGVQDFCRRHGISRAYFYLLLRRQQAPQIMKVGARTLISREAAAEWRAQMERATAQAA